jgi:hypothetical protein
MNNTELEYFLCPENKYHRSSSTLHEICAVVPILFEITYYFDTLPTGLLLFEFKIPFAMPLINLREDIAHRHTPQHPITLEILQPQRAYHEMQDNTTMTL